MPDPLTTTDEVGRLLRRDLTAGETAQAELALELVSDVVRGYCGWHIAPVLDDEVVTVVGRGGTLLALPTLRLRSVSGVKIDDVDVTDWRTLAFGLLHRPAGWPVLADTEVTMTHGYEETPGAVRVVTLAAVSRLVVNPDQIRSESMQGYAVTFTIPGTGEATGLTLTDSEEAILARFKVPSA